MVLARGSCYAQYVPTLCCGGMDTFRFGAIRFWAEALKVDRTKGIRRVGIMGWMV